MAKAGGRFLICSPGSPQALALVRLLRRHRPAAPVIGVRLPGEQMAGAGRAYDALVDYQTTAAAPGDVVVPMGANSTFHMLARADVTLGAVTLTRDALRFADKLWSLALAAELGIPVPLTWRDAAAIDRWPAFYKGAREGSAPARGIAASAADLPAGEALIYQEVIAGEGVHALGFLARDGEILAAQGHFELTSYPRTGGSAVIVEPDADPRVADYTARLLRRSNYSGWGLAEFKYCRRREDYVFMEVNTKFWASWDLALVNQPDFARLLFGIEVPAQRVRRMLFLDRALRRGPAFWPRLAAAAARGDTIRVYPGWPRQALAGLVPESLIARARR